MLEQAKDWQVSDMAQDYLEEVRTLEAKVHVCAKGNTLDRLRNKLHNVKFRFSFTVMFALYGVMKTNVECEYRMMSV